MRCIGFVRRDAVRCDIAWCVVCGVWCALCVMAWCSLTWRDEVWFGVAPLAVVCCGVVWCSVRCKGKGEKGRGHPLKKETPPRVQEIA